MIKSVTVTNYLGESKKFDLSRPELSGFAIESIDGLGPPQATINYTEISTNDGAIFNSSRTNSRNIVINLKFLWDPTIEDIRLESYKYFHVKKMVWLLIETDNRICDTWGYVETNEPNIFSKDEGTTISIICPDPYFYSAGLNGVTTTIFYGVETLFEFPFSNDSLVEHLLQMGEIKNETEKTIMYYGDAEVGVTMTLHAIGPVKNITIYNSETRETMRIDTEKLEEMTGKGMVAGDDIIINTIKGAKTIQLLRDGHYTNILNCLGKFSDWFQLAQGENFFAYVAEEGLENLQFKVENRTLYEGV